MLITIGSVTNVSITALFTGGLLPAAVAAVALVVQLLSKVAEQERLIAELRQENARLKGLVKGHRTFPQSGR